MEFYVFSSWLLCAGTLAGLLLILWKDKRLYIKPSLWFLAFFNVEAQWAGAISSQEIYMQLQDPWDFLIICQLIPFLATVISAMTFRARARETWRQVLNSSSPDSIGTFPPAGIVILGVLWFFCLSVYLLAVPLSQTGLYTSFQSVDPNQKIWAREDSFKLISNPFVRYCYMLNYSLFVKALVLVLLVTGINALKRGGVARFAISVAICPIVFISGGLQGARSELAWIVFGIVAGFWFYQKCPVQPVKVIILGIFLLLVPTIATALRDESRMDLHLIWEKLTTVTLERAFDVPMRVGLVWVDFAQRNGFWGISGVPKLAELAGVPAVNVSNIIGLEMFPTAPSSVLANTSFMFAYYSYFGEWICPALLLMILSLDAVLLTYRRISPHYIIMTMAAVNTAAIQLVSAEFLTIFVSFGYATAVVLGLALTAITKGGATSTAPSPEIPSSAKIAANPAT